MNNWSSVIFLGVIDRKKTFEQKIGEIIFNGFRENGPWNGGIWIKRDFFKQLVIYQVEHL